MGKIIFVFCLLLLASYCYAADYKITTHSIDIKVDELGNASVIEKFYLDFTSNYRKKIFREKSTELGIDLDAWKEFDPNIKLSLGGVEDLVPYSGSISFIENEDNYLELSYELKEAIMQKTNETSRVIEYELKKKFMNNFLEKPFYVIPENMIVTFLLPRETTVKSEDVTPTATIMQGEDYKKLTWQGLKKTTSMQLKYSYWKQLSPIISISLILKGFLEETRKETQALIVIIIVAIMAIIYLKRKKLKKKIVNYVIRHTEFAEHETEEEKEE